MMVVACSRGPTLEDQQRVADLERSLASCRTELAEREAELAEHREKAKVPRVRPAPVAPSGSSAAEGRRGREDLGF